jgi:hypothetical protein
MASTTAPARVTTLDADLFLRLWDEHRLTPTLARHLLKLKWPAADEARMRELADRNSEGTITPAELRELDEFVRVGLVLSILQSRARKRLGDAASARNGRG